MVLGAEPVISGRRHRTVPIDYDRVLYRERNLVARSIGWLKQGRRIATKRNGDCEITHADAEGASCLRQSPGNMFYQSETASVRKRTDAD